MAKETKQLKQHFCEVDDNLYKIVETDTAYEAFVLKDDGSLIAINPGRILAEGIPISKEEFLREQTAMKQKASERQYAIGGGHHEVGIFDRLARFTRDSIVRIRR